MPGKILFITTTSLSTNPRLLKEIKLALDLGYSVDFLCFRLGNWSDLTDNEHIANLDKVKNYFLSATKKPFVQWLVSTAILEICKWLYPYFKKNLKINSFVHNKRTWLICNYLNKQKDTWQLIVAHNLGALYPAYLLYRKLHIPFAFDIEDYHPGETCSPKEKKRREFLMRKMLPNAAYITYASPLIGKYSFDLLKGIEIPPHILINNCFLQNEFEFKQTNSDKIQLVWFSQNIAAGRGLELVLPVLYQFKEHVQLDLVGNLYPQFYNDFMVQYADILKISEPMPQAGLNKYICSFDIGLAIEQKASDFNRDICLTNKIFAYAQAGLYILATNTSAQKLFMEEHAGLGVVSGQSSGEMEKTISNLITNIKTIRKEKQVRYEYAKKLSWESESQKLTEIWAKILNCKL